MKRSYSVNRIRIPRPVMAKRSHVVEPPHWSDVPKKLHFCCAGISRLPTRSICGVYFLINLSEIVYIGQSVDVYSRVQQHRSRGEGCKEYDDAFFIEIPEKYLISVEAAFIRKFRPVYNGPEIHLGVETRFQDDEQVLNYVSELEPI